MIFKIFNPENLDDIAGLFFNHAFWGRHIKYEIKNMKYEPKI